MNSNYPQAKLNNIYEYLDEIDNDLKINGDLDVLGTITASNIHISSQTIITDHLQTTSLSSLLIGAGDIVSNTIFTTSFTSLNAQAINLSADNVDYNIMYGTTISAFELGAHHITNDNLDTTNITAVNILTNKLSGSKAVITNITTGSLLAVSGISTLYISSSSILTNELFTSSLDALHISSFSILSNTLNATSLNNLIIGDFKADDELHVVHSGKHIFGNSLESTPANMLFNPKILYPISNTPAFINPLQSVHSKHLEETLLSKSLFINGQIGLNVSNLNDVISGYAGVLGETVLSQYLPDATINVNVDAYLNDTSTKSLNIRELVLNNPVSRILARDTTDPSKVINNIHPLAQGCLITTDADGYLINAYPDRSPFDTFDNFKIWKTTKDAEKIANDTRFTTIEAKNTTQDGTIADLQTKTGELDLKDVKELQWDAATQTLKIILKNNSIIQVYIPQVAGPKGDKGDKGDQGIPGPPGESGVLIAAAAGSTAGAASGAAAGASAGATAGATAGQAAAETVVAGMAADIAALQAESTAKTAKDLAQDTAIASNTATGTANTAAIATAAATLAAIGAYFASRAGTSANSNNVSQLGTATKPSGTTPFYSTGLQVKGEHLTDGTTTAYSGEIVMTNPNYDGATLNSGDIVMKTGNANRMTIKKSGQVQLGNINDLETEINSKITSTNLNNSLLNYATITSVSNLNTTLSSSFATLTNVSSLSATINSTLSSVLNVTGINILLNNYATTTNISTLISGTTLNSTLLNYVTTGNILNYITSGSVIFNNYATTTNISTLVSGATLNSTLLNYVTTGNILNYITSSSAIFNNYALQSSVTGINNTLPSLLSISNANSTFSSYLTINNAASTYATQTQLSNFNINTSDFFSKSTTGDQIIKSNILMQNDTPLIDMGDSIFGYMRFQIYGGAAASMRYGSDLMFIRNTQFGPTTVFHLEQENVKFSLLTANKVPFIDGNRYLVSSSCDSTKLSFLSSVTSDIQTQFNNINTTLPSFLSVTGASQIYATKTSTSNLISSSTLTSTLSSYLTSANAANTYATQTNISTLISSSTLTSTLTSYLTTANAASTYATIATVNNKADKSYVDTQDGLRLLKSGDTMTGDLTMNGNYINCSNDPSTDNQLTRKKYVDTLIIGRIPRTGDTSLIGDYQTSGTITAAGLVSTGGIRGTAFLTGSAVIEYNRVSDRGKWFKIINIGTSPNTYYSEFHITYAVAGEHAHIHFIVSGMYNAAPNIKVLHSTIYGGAVVQYLRISLDNASIYYQGFVEMYLADYSWYEANINIYVYGINNAPLNSYYSLINTKTAGTSSGYSYYAVDTAVGFDMNYAGTRYKMGNTIFYTNAPTTIDSTLSTPARIAITNSDPGDLISKYYSSANRYGIGQYSQGTVRVFGSNSYTGTSIRFSRATNDDTSGAATFTDLMTMRYNGVLDIKGGNGGDWAYQYVTKPGSLIIGRTDTNFGGDWQVNNSNAAGLMMECLDVTEIQIHDSGARLASFMYYSGNNFTIGRDSGYGVTSTLIAGFLNVTNTQQISTGANQNFLTLYANSNNSTEYINLRFSHQGNSSYIQSYRTSGFWRVYLMFFTVNASGGSVQIAQMTDQGFQCFGSFYTAGNAWCGDSTTLGNGCSNFSQGWDRCLIYANGYSTGGGYFYYNQGNAYGTISDRRIKKDFERISENQSVAFIKALEPTSFCLKEQKSCTRKKINEKGEEIEEEICPAVCSCRQDGWIAQNVLEACKISGASKSVVNNWYDYEQELNKPEEERKTLIGVSDRPILSHTVNTVKYLLNENQQLKQQIENLTTVNEAQNTKITELENIIIQHNTLLSQIVAKLNN